MPKVSEGQGQTGCELRSERFVLERATGIEPALSAWEADVLPLNYARVPGRTAGTSGGSDSARWLPSLYRAI